MASAIPQTGARLRRNAALASNVTSCPATAAELSGDDVFHVVLRARAVSAAAAKLHLGTVRLAWACIDDNGHGRGGGGISVPPSAAMPCLPLTVTMPTLRCEPRALSVSLEAPAACTVGAPAAMTLTLRNHSAGVLGLAVAVAEARGFLAAGPRRTHVTLLPGASERLAVTLVPLVAGFAVLPAMSVFGGADLRHAVLAPPEGPTVFVYPQGC